MKFIILFLFSLNLFANELCNPSLEYGGGQDYNDAIRVVVSEICKAGLTTSNGKPKIYENSRLGDLKSSLEKCKVEFNCERVKALFLNEIISKSSQKPSLKPVVESLKRNPSTSRFVDSSSSDSVSFRIRAYKASVRDQIEERKRDIRFRIEQHKEYAKEAADSKRDWEEYVKRCTSLNNCDQREISELDAKYRGDLEMLNNNEKEIKSLERQFDPQGTSGKVKALISKYHAETQKVLEQKVKDDPTCKGLNITTIDQCAKVSEEFRQHVQRANKAYKKVSDNYKEFDEELEDAIDDDELLELMSFATISQVRKELGVDQGDDAYMMNELYKKMDESLLGKYIDEKAMAAACAANSGDIQCNAADSSSKQISNIENLSKEIQKQTDSLRKARSGGVFQR